MTLSVAGPPVRRAGDAGDAPRLGSLAQRVLEESRWIPDEEERAILVRAIQRLRQKVGPRAWGWLMWDGSVKHR